MSNSIIWLQATGSSLARGRQVISYQTRSAEAFSFFNNNNTNNKNNNKNQVVDEFQPGKQDSFNHSQKIVSKVTTTSVDFIGNQTVINRQASSVTIQSFNSKRFRFIYSNGICFRLLLLIKYCCCCFCWPDETMKMTPFSWFSSQLSFVLIGTVLCSHSRGRWRRLYFKVTHLHVGYSFFVSFVFQLEIVWFVLYFSFFKEEKYLGNRDECVFLEIGSSRTTFALFNSIDRAIEI